MALPQHSSNLTASDGADVRLDVAAGYARQPDELLLRVSRLVSVALTPQFAIEDNGPKAR